ncbi:MAG: FAD:protein FMN transferase [Chitinophagaceae bacterium]
MFFLPLNRGEEHIIKGNAQGTTYFISYFHDSISVNKQKIDSIFEVIDHSLSLYQHNSLISIFNRTGNVIMDPHMKKVIEKANEVAAISDRAFDITVKPLVDYWTKNGYKTSDRSSIKLIRKMVNYQYLQCQNDTLKSDRSGVKIDCNGIAQGYTVDILYEYLMSRGIENFLIELGGEIRCRGKKSNGEDWRIGMESPSQSNYLFSGKKVLQLKGRAATTAGNYRKYLESGGEQLAHIIDPISGYPADNGIISVTVLADDAMTADAWDDVFFVKGLPWTKHWLEKNNFLELLILYLDEKGSIREFSSKGLKAYTLQTE